MPRPLRRFSRDGRITSRAPKNSLEFRSRAGARIYVPVLVNGRPRSIKFSTRPFMDRASQIYGCCECAHAAHDRFGFNKAGENARWWGGGDICIPISYNRFFQSPTVNWPALALYIYTSPMLRNLRETDKQLSRAGLILCDYQSQE